VNGIAVQHAKGGLRVRDHARAVVVKHRLQPGEAGHQRLGAAREAGEEVRLDEAGQDRDRRLQVQPVEINGVAARGRAPVHQRAVVARVVVDHAVAARDHGSEHLIELGRRVGAVRPRRHQDSDVLARHTSPLKLSQQGRQHTVAGHRARAVVDHDHDRIGGSGQLAQRPRPERRADGGQDRRPLVGQTRRLDRLDHIGTLLRRLDLQPRAPVGQHHFH